MASQHTKHEYMSSIKTTQIDGDVSVGRNVAIGGKADIAGSAHIGHNLKVDGWLEAPNIKGANKGIFLTVQELREAYPVPHDGWMAGVGASTPFTAYVGKGGDWVPTGGTIEVTVDMTEEIEQARDDALNQIGTAKSEAESNISLEKEEALDAIAEAIEGLEVHYDIETDKGATKDVQLKDGQGNKLMPRTTYENLEGAGQTGMICEDDSDFSISDLKGYKIVEIKDGHIKTKNFDSRSISNNFKPFQHRIPFKVTVDVTNFLADDFDAVDVNTYVQPTYYDDNCVIYLPDNYTQGGNPVKAIIYCKHGASTITEASDDLFTSTMGRIFPYLVSLGYAIIAADGLPDGWASSLGLCERVVGNYVAVQSTIKAWEYAIENYNIDRNCAFIFGYSQGGHYAQNVIDNTIIPIVAAAELSPVCSMQYHQWDLAASVSVGGVTFSKGARLNIARIFGYPAVATNAELEALQYDPSKEVGYDPWTRNVENPYEGFVKSGNLWQLPKGTSMADITMKKHTRCPIKIWCANNDPTLGVDVMKVFIKSIKNSGQVADIQVYSSGGHSIPNSQTEKGDIEVNGVSYGYYGISLDIADWFRINGGY